MRGDPVPPAPLARLSLSGLYVILDTESSHRRSLPDLLKQAAEGGARIFQYRNKTASMLEAYRQAVLLRQAATDAGARLLINDRCDLALAVDADGVHLGQQDLPIHMARAMLGPDKLIGISTHTDAQVTAATASGADYLGFGPIFPPGSKRDHDPVVGVDGLRRIRRLTSLPVFAIGGIALDHVHSIIEAGADGVAVISAIAQAQDVTAVTRAFVSQFRSPDPPVR
ncbi:MAG TPA: thiamine phosphate synthase [Nitrospiraceae bacterium]